MPCLHNKKYKNTQRETVAWLAPFLNEIGAPDCLHSALEFVASAPYCTTVFNYDEPESITADSCTKCWVGGCWKRSIGVIKQDLYEEQSHWLRSSLINHFGKATCNVCGAALRKMYEYNNFICMDCEYRFERWHNNTGSTFEEWLAHIIIKKPKWSGIKP